MTSESLKDRVDQFNRLALPGQRPVMHMGTSYLVNDLWREIERLRAELDRMNTIFCPPGQPGPVELLAAAEEEIEKLRAELELVRHGLEESVKLQSHYAGLLNMYDSGQRRQFDGADAWLQRLQDIRALAAGLKE